MAGKIRPNIELLKKNKKRKGVIMSNNVKIYRNFALMVLKKFGYEEPATLPNMGESVLLKTGAKLAKTKAGYYLHSYDQFGFDVNKILVDAWK